jgi:hypothetical protein
MKSSGSHTSRPARNKRSYWLANTSVTHLASAKSSASLFLATHTPKHKSPAVELLFEIAITVDSIHVADLRHVASEICAEKIDSFEIQPTKKMTQRLVRLRCFGKTTIAQLMSAVVSKLESAEFGRVYAV